MDNFKAHLNGTAITIKRHSLFKKKKKNGAFSLILVY